MLTKKHPIFESKNIHDAEMIANIARDTEEFYLQKAREATITQIKSLLRVKGYRVTDELAEEFLTGRI
ncbi:hypothetical protein [Crocosphaera sp.]|uniref:hypothetical protein n=1 Tax=Crocosphaera sp. TaxID=2729996 RepID=UPI0026123399|nr:hypothetical protein [Crocosphaera sp.]MDJ0579067.1 hypothetical protein [Crocosphaera sp.]